MLRNSTSGVERARKWRVYVALAAATLFVLCMWYFNVHRTGSSSNGSRLTNLPLSTKTPYLAPNTTAPPPALDGLDLVQVQYIYRHGARYPTPGDMSHIRDIYGLEGLSVPHDWINSQLIDESNAGILAQYGYREITGIAQRTLQRYPEFMAERTRRPESIRFVSSEFQRSYMSARTFQSVVDSGNRTKPVTVLPLEDDTMLAMKKQCPLWTQEKVVATLNASREVAAFDLIHGLKLRQRMSSKIGVKLDLLTVDHVSALYLMCGYEVSLFALPNTWCSLFDSDTAALMELRNDIKYSRVYGPFGAIINRKMACALFTTIFQYIDSALHSPQSAVSTFWFGHAETVMFVSTLLNLEQALGSENMPIAGAMSPAQARHRGFKTSVIAPFSTNLGIELYKDQHAQPLFRLLLNEHVVRLPECANEICSLDILRNKLGDAIGCDYDRRPQAAAVANDSAWSATPTIRPLNMAMLKHPEVRRVLIRLALFTILAFTPVIFAAIALSFSEPSNAGKTAIYMVTFTITFSAIGYGGWKSYRQILQATEPSAPPRIQHPHIPTPVRVSSAVDAFSSEQRYYMHGQHAGSAQTLADGSGDNTDGRVLSLTPYNPPMPQPPASYSTPYAPPVSMPQPHVPMDMPNPRVPEPAYHGYGQPQQNAPTYVPLNGGDNAPRSLALATAPPPPRHNAGPPSSPPSRFGLPRRLSASASHAEGLRKSEDAESPYDDDDSAQLYSFDKVRVSKDNNPRRLSRRSSHRHSVGSIPATEWNAQSQHAGDNSAPTTSTSVAFNIHNDSRIQGAIMQAQRPMLVAADQLSVSQGSSSDLPLLPANEVAPAPRRPSPPNQALPPRPDINLSQVNDGYVETWLESSTQPEYHPNMRRIGLGMSTQSLAASSIDLIIPEKFAAPEASKITKTVAKAQQSSQGRSIYGERGLLEDSNNNQSNATIDHLVSDMMASSVSNVVGQGMSAAPMPAPRPTLKSAGTFGNEDLASKANKSQALSRSDGASSERTPVSTTRDLVGPDGPLPESSYQKEASTKAKAEDGWRRQSNNPFAAAIGAASGNLVNLPSDHGGNGAADSRYFSAVSLPHPPHQPAAAMNTFHEEEEGDDFLDDDSDDGFVSKVQSPAAPNEPGSNADGTKKQKTVSINFNSMAAELAKALTQPNGPHESLLSGPLARSHDSVSIEILTPELGSPMHAEQVTTSFAQRAVVHGRHLQPHQDRQNAMSFVSMSPTAEYGDPDHTTLNLK
ncbi:hypothetical protein GGI20_002454 [Coemansia sp. BCRC 34301]|nr:hypothetical protein GGI20_002454 [Coemansia sp. BCRC 34301]